MLASSATVLALQARERTGLGDHIEVPLASAVMEGLCYNSIKIEGLPDRYITQREQEIARRRAEGLPMNLSYEASTVKVLEEVGYTEKEIEKLLEDGVASQSWSTEYLPS